MSGYLNDKNKSKLSIIIIVINKDKQPEMKHQGNIIFSNYRNVHNKYKINLENIANLVLNLYTSIIIDL